MLLMQVGLDWYHGDFLAHTKFLFKGPRAA